MKDDDHSYEGLGLCGILTIIFILLKLTKAISWSWWWVFSPLWIPYVFIIILCTLVALIETISYHIRGHFTIKSEWDSDLDDKDKGD